MLKLKDSIKPNKKSANLFDKLFQEELKVVKIRVDEWSAAIQKKIKKEIKDHVNECFSFAQCSKCETFAIQHPEWLAQFRALKRLPKTRNHKKRIAELETTPSSN
ncbi:MAG: hypothetical protein HY401_05195 [Elusimicrobia bacterium]|nr:hypothetical protein [Elusimicrobiota bacterium]